MGFCLKWNEWNSKYPKYIKSIFSKPGNWNLGCYNCDICKHTFMQALFLYHQRGAHHLTYSLQDMVFYFEVIPSLATLRERTFWWMPSLPCHLDDICFQRKLKSCLFVGQTPSFIFLIITPRESEWLLSSIVCTLSLHISLGLVHSTPLSLKSWITSFGFVVLPVRSPFLLLPLNFSFPHFFFNILLNFLVNIATTSFMSAFESKLRFDAVSPKVTPLVFF